MGAAFGIRTDAAGSSSKVVAQAAPRPAGGSRSGVRLVAFGGLLAGALLLFHAALGWLPWVSRVPGLASPGRAAIAGVVLVLLGGLGLLRARRRQAAARGPTR